MKLTDRDLVIFEALVLKFPKLEPRRLINAVIKHRFLRYFPLDDIPREEIFYIGFQALYTAWKTMDTREDLPAFLKFAWGMIAQEIYFFIKHEYPSSHAMRYLKSQPYIVRLTRRESKDYENPYKDREIPIDAYSDNSGVGNIYTEVDFNKVVNAVFEVCLETKHALRDIELIKFYLLGFTAREIAKNSELGFINGTAVINRLKRIFENVRVKLGIDPNLSLFLFLERRKIRHRVNAENHRKTARERTRRYRARLKTRTLAGKQSTN